MANDLTVDVGFDVHSEDLSTAVQEFSRDAGKEFSGLQESIADLSATIRDMVSPLRDFRDLAKEISGHMKDAKDHAASIRDSVNSSRRGGGGAGGGGSGGGSGGGVGDILSIAGMGGGMASFLPGIISAALMGGGAIGLGGIANMDLTRLGSGGMFGAPMEMFRGLGRMVGVTDPIGGARQEERMEGLREQLHGRGWFAPLGAMARGYSASEVMSAADTPQLMGLAGSVQGLASSMGQGPVGMFSGLVGRGYGSQWGAQIAGNIFGNNPLVQAAGGQIGGSLMQGMVGNYINEGMARLPGYYSTMAGMAAPAMYGADNRQIRGLGLGRWGMGPEQVGPEFSALYQGFGGGELTTDTLRTSLAYSRAYGVSMGSQAQAVGGLINIGGGGQGASAADREEILLRVMTDAVATGFGRRLPEYANAVSSSMQAVMGGPALVRQGDMHGITMDMSRLTGQVARTHDLSLSQAQRMISPYASAPGSMLRNMMTGGGDPFAMAQLWGANRERFGGDVWSMQEGLASAQAHPFSQGMQFLSPMIGEQIRMAGGNRGILGFGLQNMFQGLGMDMSFDNISQIVNRGQEAFTTAQAEGRTLTDEEVTEALLGIETTQENTGDELQETMRDVQRSGEAIMNSQLGAMRASAGYAWQQLGISAAMAEDAARFHNMMANYQRVSAELLSNSAISEQIGVMSNLFGPESVQRLQRGGPNAVQDWMKRALADSIEAASHLGETTAAAAESTSAAVSSRARDREATLLDVANRALSLGRDMVTGAVGGGGTPRSAPVTPPGSPR